MTRDFFSDLTDDAFDATSAMHPADAANVREQAHIVNGGDASFPCPSCKGRGKFVSYTGRVVGDCFKCKGKGQVGARVAGAAKAKATREANVLAFRNEHDAEVRYAQRRAEKSTFYAGLLEKLDTYGSWTDGQVALIRRDMVADEEFRAKKAAEREENAPVVDLTAIDALFAKATENAIKRPIFRTETLTLKKAASTGRNPGALYVTDTATDAYLGKLVNGKFFSAGGTIDAVETAASLQAIAIDPTSEAIKYGRKFGNCGCCGRFLVNPVSILAGIGPVCASKWGLDWRRDLATEEYAQMKAEEVGE